MKFLLAGLYLTSAVCSHVSGRWMKVGAGIGVPNSHKVVVAGSLETSFSDDISKGFKFGNPPQTAIEAMGGLVPEDQ